MTFQDMRNIVAKAKAELHEDIVSLESKVVKSNAMLYKEIREVNRKLDLILKTLDTVETNREHGGPCSGQGSELRK